MPPTCVQKKDSAESQRRQDAENARCERNPATLRRIDTRIPNPEKLPSFRHWSAMQIRLAQETDLPSIMELTRQVILHLQQTGIDQWDEHYPTAVDFLKDIRAGEFSVAELSGQLLGGLCLNTAELSGYETADWQADSFLVVHRLLISPEFQGKGIASQLMAFAEQQARRQGKASVRLDCFTENPRAIALYERLGYRCCGQAGFRKGRFLLYEKVWSET